MSADYKENIQSVKGLGSTLHLMDDFVFPQKSNWVQCSLVGLRLIPVREALAFFHIKLFLVLINH